jgi:lysophospholipase L1-like esterase
VITDPRAFRVLCFGDSNTYGALADGTEGGRLSSGLRWPGRLQHLLGGGYDVLEEGLNGRTTDLDYQDRPGCNGFSYFLPCLLSHHRVDAIVVMLGTNDLKSCFDRPPRAIAEALGGYVDLIGDVTANVTGPGARPPTTILVSPIWIDDAARLYQDLTADAFDGAGVARSRELDQEVRRVARERNVGHVDAAQVAVAGDDGLHLTVESHARLAERLADEITHRRGGAAHAVPGTSGMSSAGR